MKLFYQIQHLFYYIVNYYCTITVPLINAHMRYANAYLQTRARVERGGVTKYSASPDKSFPVIP